MTSLLDPLGSLSLSTKQYRSILDSTSRYNIWSGAVRAGKTFASLLRFAEFCKDGPKGDFAIVGKSLGTIKRNVLNPLCEILGNRFQYFLGKGEAKIFDRVIHLIGATDERAEHKIRGSTLACAYVDELTIIPRSVFEMLRSRLSIPGAKLFASTNPDSPFHWCKTELIDRAKDGVDVKLFEFYLEDNPSLDPLFVEQLRREYRGLWYERYIAGKWVLAEGTVYDFFDVKENTIHIPPGAAKYYVVGVDYGTTNPTAFTMIGYSEKTFPNMWLEKEYYYDSRKELRQKSDTEYADDLKKFLTGYNVKAIYIDPSAVSLRVELLRQGFSGIMEAENEVLDGLRFHGMLLANGTFKICSNCVNTIQEYGTYRWDERACRRGEDKPIKENDHLMDSIRYALYTHFFKGGGKRTTPEELERLRNEAWGVGEHGKFFDDRMW